MTTRREKTFLAGLATIAAVGAMLLASPNADASIESDAAYLCSQLDVDSSPASFYAEVSDMLASGLTKDQAADVLTYAMTTECPRYRDEFEVALRQAEKRTPLLRAV